VRAPVIFVVLASTNACIGERPSADVGLVGDRCGAEIRECDAGLVCLRGRCRQPCVSTSDCEPLHYCDSGACVPVEDYCDANCFSRANVEDAICEPVGGEPVCQITACVAGWEDIDGEPANGCESLCAASGTERCNGLDDDCDGRVDDLSAAELVLECGARFPSALAVASWRCEDACAIHTCDSDRFDANGAVSDGCEYTCTATGTETCNGLDDDCTGLADDMTPQQVDADCAAEYPAAGHVVAWACLGDCAIAQCDAGWSDVSGEPDDGCDANCTPTAPPTEVCDGADNDCDGTADNPGASGCETFYRDQDSDGTGVDDSLCLCAPASPYTATTSGDCNDALATCVSDCTTDADADGALDCADGCVDVDGDGYGRQGGMAVTCLGNDCDDDPAACGVACYAGATEACDGYDNNCDDVVDEGCAVVPSNGVAICGNPMQFTVPSGSTIVIDTTDATIDGVSIASTTVTQGVGLPDIVVFSFDTIDIELGGTLSVVGTHALALTACDDAAIAGTIDACASTLVSGPGGGDGGDRNQDGSGSGAGGAGTAMQSNPWNDSGSGGGGHCGTGGAGGAAGDSAPQPPGTPGPSFGDPGLIPLVGGAGGGGGAIAIMTVGKPGGGGGGAIQISSGGTLSVSGTINACGAGGGGPQGEGSSGGGGGAGGGILLEALAVNVSGTLAANGGGGGGGNDWDPPNGDTRGEDGPAESRRAAGGLGVGGADPGYAGDGGAGGAGSSIHGDAGEDVPDDHGNAGGGGAGAGRIRINTLGNSGLTTDPSAVISPVGPCYTTGAVTTE